MDKDADLSRADSHKPTILIIDDDASNLAILTEYLDGEDFDVIVAEEGRLGYERACYARPDLILLDVLMPGIDGFEVCRRLKADKTTRDIPVIFMTALADTANKLEGFAAGAVDYVTKPSQREEILARVGVHLHNRQLTVRLQEAKDFLETRVEERTAALAGANKELRSEIAERKQAQAALQKSQERFRALYEDNPSMYFTVDHEGMVLSVNPFGAQQLGYTVQELIGQPVLSVFHPDDKAVLEQQVANCIKKLGEVFSWELRKIHKKGHTIWVREAARAVRGMDDTVLVLVVCEDITERKHAEEALRAEKAFTDNALDTMRDAFIVLDLKGKFVRWNRVVGEITGYSDEKLTGMRLTDFFEGEDTRQVTEAFESILEKGHASMEETVLTSEGKQIPIEFTGTLLTASDGTPANVCFVGRDITERKKLEAQLYQSQKMEAIGALAGGVAHDFNNLMTAVLGYCELMLSRIPSDSPLRRDILQIRGAGERTASLTTQLLAFSRKQVVQPKLLDLNILIKDTAKMLKRLIGENIDLNTRLAPEISRIMADPGQIDQVLVNLVINARDAMPNGGKLTIETADTYLDDAYTSTHMETKPGHYVMLAVSDTGVGMNQETLSRLFEPFFTTKEKGKGTGLGLATVYGIVKQNGGTIWVYSEPGMGATFKVYLPRVDETVEPAPRTAKSDTSATGGSETVLVVEDEELVRELVSSSLRAVGYQVLEATNGRKALEIFGSHDSPIQMLLTDVVMPEMSGPELVKEIESRCDDLKVLYISGYADNAIVHHGVLDPDVAYLQKPFTPEELVHKVRKVLDEA